MVEAGGCFGRSPRSNSASLEKRRPVQTGTLHVEQCCTCLRATRMKTNITIKVDADLIRKAKLLAAEEGSSISALLAAKLEEIVRQRKNYEAARRRALAGLRKGYDLGWTPPTSRDELHER